MRNLLRIPYQNPRVQTRREAELEACAPSRPSCQDEALNASTSHHNVRGTSRVQTRSAAWAQPRSSGLDHVSAASAARNTENPPYTAHPDDLVG